MSLQANTINLSPLTEDKNLGQYFTTQKIRLNLLVVFAERSAASEVQGSSQL